MFSLVGVALVSLLIGRDVDAQRWPQFRGPSFGVAAETDAPPTRFDADTNVVWKTHIPHGASSPVIWGDYLFITGVDGDRLGTFALRRSDGALRWERTLEVERFEPMYSDIATPAASTPVTDGKTVYVYFGSFGLIAYDFEGEERWRKPMLVAITEFGSGTSPLLGRALRLGPFSIVGESAPGDGARFWNDRRLERRRART